MPKIKQNDHHTIKLASIGALSLMHLLPERGGADDKVTCGLIRKGLWPPANKDRAFGIEYRVLDSKPFPLTFSQKDYRLMRSGAETCLADRRCPLSGPADDLFADLITRADRKKSCVEMFTVNAATLLILHFLPRKTGSLLEAQDINRIRDVLAEECAKRMDVDAARLSITILPGQDALAKRPRDFHLPRGCWEYLVTRAQVLLDTNAFPTGTWPGVTITAVAESLGVTL